MPITPAGSQKPQQDCDVSKPGADVRVVTGMPGFDGVQTFTLELLEYNSGTPFLQVGHRDHAACVVDHLGNPLERGQGLLYECRATATKKAIEGIIRVQRASVTNHCPSHVGPAERPPG